MPGAFDVGPNVEYTIYGPNNLMTVYGKGDEDSPDSHSLSVTISAGYDISPSLRIETSIQDRYVNNDGDAVNDIALDLSPSCSF